MIGQGSELVISNTAEVVLPGDGGAVVTSASNTVSTPLTGLAGEIGFYGTGDFSGEIDQVGFGEEVYLQVNSGLCNVSAEIDEAVITVTTSPDGDT